MPNKRKFWQKIKDSLLNIHSYSDFGMSVNALVTIYYMAFGTLLTLLAGGNLFIFITLVLPAIIGYALLVVSASKRQRTQAAYAQYDFSEVQYAH